jgi:hypothetical protein
MTTSSILDTDTTSPTASETIPVDNGPVDDPSTSDSLELELRHLPGVDYVAMTRHASLLLIELGTDGSVAGAGVAEDARRIAEGWLDNDVEVRLIDEDATPSPGTASSSLRVQLLAAVDGRARPGADQRVEIHLAHLGRRSVAHAGQDDPIQVAEAALTGLRHLGFPVPFEVEAVHLLPEEVGAGILVVLVDRLSGERRRGVAAGRSTGETVARAVLNSLNRYLQTVDRRPDGR